jgi:drug/metabolite transporter (DMT)-like permease
MNSSLHRKYQGELLLLVAAMIWGFAFYFQKTAMLSIGPLLFVGVRAAIAAIAVASRLQRATPTADKHSRCHPHRLPWRSGYFLRCISATIWTGNNHRD